MALDTSIVFAPWTIFWGTFVLVVIAFIIITVVEKQVRKKLKFQKQKEAELNEKASAILKSNGSIENNLVALDNFAREFFLEKYSINKYLDNSTRAELLMKKKYEKAALFFDRMQSIMYSGIPITKPKLHSLVSEFESLTRETTAAEEKETRKSLMGRRLKKMFSFEKSKPAKEKPNYKIKHIKFGTHRKNSSLKKLITFLGLKLKFSKKQNKTISHKKQSTTPTEKKIAKNIVEFSENIRKIKKDFVNSFYPKAHRKTIRTNHYLVHHLKKSHK